MFFAYQDRKDKFYALCVETLGVGKGYFGWPHFPRKSLVSTWEQHFWFPSSGFWGNHTSYFKCIANGSCGFIFW